MSIELETKQDETITPAANEETAPVVTQEESPDKVKELELENARLQGMLDAKAQPAPTPIQSVESEHDKYTKTKQTVLSDSQVMDDDEFKEKYKMSKEKAENQFLKYEFERENQKRAEDMAILRAENQIVKKYGDKYSKYQEKIEATIQDLSPSVRQDPQKLAQHIEITLRSHLWDEKDDTPTPKHAKKEPHDMSKRIIDSGFEKPNAVLHDNPQPQKKSDEIPDEYKPLATAFGLSSEKERQKFKDIHIDVAYGPNKWLTKNGVETIKS